ncbi:ABC-type transporter, integral membrane subunit [Spirochaeta thermophila DSM 6578]|uniref:ABC-type transporter, integral membrane subunit n=1 Tax=Winmispira thermophila (strain ATCC 700085 / DSM 6578 / Z-1203) TaxID=869211 RepID=G0GDA4_WINT7|nr:sugar ABC transporter permease [Spirochaeta thermophila]AEJ60530.1 ABC-type transporter, integral membrane subunit [Spirochaeta thermophila DSM 6578]
MTVRERRELMGYFSLVGPALLLYTLILAYPVVFSLGLSFTDYNPNVEGTGKFVGVSHYLRMVRDPLFWHAFKNNLIVVAVSVFGQIPIGFVLAYILYRKMIRSPRFFQSVIFLPQFLSTIVVGILWKRLFEADGPVARLTQWFTRDPSAQFDYMLRPETVMYPIAFVLLWMYTGFYMVVFLANLQKLDAQLIEAAKIDGATEPQIFVKIIMPLLSGTILVSSILAIAGSLKSFDLIFAITDRGLTRQNALVLSIYMYQVGFHNYDDPLRFAYGATIANSIIFISVGLILLANFISRQFASRGVE